MTVNRPIGKIPRHAHHWRQSPKMECAPGSEVLHLICGCGARREETRIIQGDATLYDVRVTRPDGRIERTASRVEYSGGVR